jgi:hypothetical protein
MGIEQSGYQEFKHKSIIARFGLKSASWLLRAISTAVSPLLAPACYHFNIPAQALKTWLMLDCRHCVENPSWADARLM